MNINVNAKKAQHKIIIASEDVNFKNILATKLRVENYDIKLSNSGFHTLFLIEQTVDVNILIVNDNMRDMSGIELIELTRSILDSSALSIIYISKSKANESETYTLAGANEFFNQSTNYGQIVNAIEKLVKAHSNDYQLKKSA